MTDIFDETIPFEEKVHAVYRRQRRYNPVYARFCDALGIDKVTKIAEIPLLPVQAFKHARVLCAEDYDAVDFSRLTHFRSSGTGSMQPSTHFISEPALYEASVIKGMDLFYNREEFVIWAYTPGYHENPHSSLIRMLDILIRNDKDKKSRFLGLNTPVLQAEIDEVTASGKKLMLFGAAFGLLDLIEQGTVKLPEKSIIIETGGMKTYRREMPKEELHFRLAEGFGVRLTDIHSEYGMGELLSQAYSKGSNWFKCVPWMRVSIRNADNPAETVKQGAEGKIGIIDLANRNSCAFLLTEDRGVMRRDGRFKVLGRWNPQNLRGCNFLIDRD